MLPVEPDLLLFPTGLRSASPAGLDRRIATIGSDDHADRSARFGGKLQAAALEKIDGPLDLDHDRPEDARAQRLFGNPEAFQWRLRVNKRHRIDVHQSMKSVRAKCRDLPPDDPETGTAKLSCNTGCKDARGSISRHRRHDLVDPPPSQMRSFLCVHVQPPTIRMRHYVLLLFPFNG